MNLIKIGGALVLGIYLANNYPDVANTIYNYAILLKDELIIFIEGLQKG